MYFQRYVAEPPSAGEIVLFDSSWYNRAGIERGMNFCSDEEYRESLHACPLFEQILINSGIILTKYWFSVNDEEQEARFQDRMRIAHLLSKVPYKDLKPVEIELPPRQSADYKRPKMSSQRFVPEIY